MDDVDSFYTQMSTDIVTILDDLAPLLNGCFTTKRQMSGNKFDLSPEATLAKRSRRLLERRYEKHRTEENRKLYRESCAAAARLINASCFDYNTARLTVAAFAPRELWKITKDILNCNVNKCFDPLCKLNAEMFGFGR